MLSYLLIYLNFNLNTKGMLSFFIFIYIYINNRPVIGPHRLLSAGRISIRRIPRSVKLYILTPNIYSSVCRNNILTLFLPLTSDTSYSDEVWDAIPGGCSCFTAGTGLRLDTGRGVKLVCLYVEH